MQNFSLCAIQVSTSVPMIGNVIGLTMWPVVRVDGSFRTAKMAAVVVECYKGGAGTSARHCAEESSMRIYEN